jgi:hypothetical protein
MSASELKDLSVVLQWLDRRLQQAIAQAHLTYGPEAIADPYRGLHIDLEAVQRDLSREPGVPLFPPSEADMAWTLAQVIQPGSRWEWLQQTFGLSAFDLGVVAIALAPEVDRRYERIYAYLQDDVRARRPSIDLVLHLLCESVAERLLQGDQFAPEAPLVRSAVLHVIPDPNHPQPTLLAHIVKLDDQVVRLLLGWGGLDPRLAAICTWIEPGTDSPLYPWQATQQQRLIAFVHQSREKGQPLRLFFEGADTQEKRQMAIALAQALAVPLLVADLEMMLAAKPGFEVLLPVVLRETGFRDALLYVEGIDALRDPERRGADRQLLRALATHRGGAIVAGRQLPEEDQAELRGLFTVPFPQLNFAQRRQCWQAHLTATGIPLADAALDALADRFRLDADQIAQAVAIADQQSQWLAADPTQPTPTADGPAQPRLKHLFAAARSQSGQALNTLAQKIEPKSGWDDIVLPPDPLAQLREICQQATYRHRVFEQWGFDRKLSLGKGLNVLFSGPPGTGKTMAAEVIAQDLQLDLYKIDLSQVVSKYIGETEKNLDRIFTAAETANAILFFDEADALFGKRSEVRDAHDRYANIEIGYLLQKMEEYEGVAILATNLRQNLDEAFVRRLTFMVHFPAPDEAHRRRIWSGIWPAETPRADDVDLDFLARQFKLSGGHIKNIALAAAFLAAPGEAVTMTHLVQAVRREYQKLGKGVAEADLKGAWETSQAQVD